MKTKSKIKLVLTGLGILGLFGFFHHFIHQELFIESFESKTSKNLPVFNKIKFEQKGNLDIWMMNQSHHGLNAKENEWDRLAIVVDTKNSTATFYQITPGPLVWSEDLKNKQVEYKVSCGNCHSNGPRAMRDNPYSNNVELGITQKIQREFLNLKIKNYGKITNVEAPLQNRVVRFHQIGDYKTLELKSCQKCHGGDHWYSRNALTSENVGSIYFMVTKKLMPPQGFTLSAKDKVELLRFLR